MQLIWWIREDSASLAWWWSVVQEVVVSLPKTVAIVFDSRWRHWGVAETRMPLEIGRPALPNVAVRCFESIMEPLLSNPGESVRRRWIIRRGLGMGTSGQHHGQKQRRDRNELLHVSVLAEKPECPSNLIQAFVHRAGLSIL
jgi:hypothetical protein